MKVGNKSINEVAEMISKMIKLGYSKEYIERIIKL